ncbi:hypothetical protein [Falsiroseomonas sp. HW251]|uniref:hypothetical protein n=1 Tax=Falsiroseomonas sp. HW251 TaxID=3390998 RepID=UPI003D317699
MLIAVAAVMLAVSAVVTFMTAVEVDIRLRGVPAVATIEEVGAAQRSKQGMRYPVRLRVDGTVAWGERAMLVTSSWEGGPRRPQPGQGVEVLVVPDDPPRLVPIGALDSMWERLASVAAAWLIAGGALLALRRTPRG